MIHFVILAGGRGERFWPLSSPELPKQFLKLFGKESFFQLTLKRLRQLKKGFSGEKIKFWVVTEARYRKWIRSQAPELPGSQIILEPVARNTAAAIGLAAKRITAGDPDGVMICFPSDHWIRPVAVLRKALQNAVRSARETEGLGLLGVKPNFPSTGLGYIELAGRPRSLNCYPVARFHEKPDLDRARRWIQTGRYLWNSGIFVWQGEALLRELRNWLPQISDKLNLKEYHSIKPVSIDYGVLEKSRSLFCVPVSLHWDDLGTWENLWHYAKKDKMDNALFKGTEWKKLETKGCLVYSENLKIATLGVSNLIIVQSSSGVLICDRDRAQQVRQLVMG